MNTRILAPPNRARKNERDEMVGETPWRARVKNTRFRVIQWCRRRLQRWTTPYRPTNERAAVARSANRCEPMRARLSRGRTLTETVLLVASATLARYCVWISGRTTRLNEPSVPIWTVATVRDSTPLKDGSSRSLTVTALPAWAFTTEPKRPTAPPYTTID